MPCAAGSTRGHHRGRCSLLPPRQRLDGGGEGGQVAVIHAAGVEAGGEVGQDVDEVTLSQREHDVLTRLRDGHTNTEIARQLFLSNSTVKATVSNLLHKLGATRRTDAATRANELGITCPGPPQHAP